LKLPKRAAASKARSALRGGKGCGIQVNFANAMLKI